MAVDELGRGRPLQNLGDGGRKVSVTKPLPVALLLPVRDAVDFGLGPVYYLVLPIALDDAVQGYTPEIPFLMNRTHMHPALALLIVLPVYLVIGIAYAVWRIAIGLLLLPAAVCLLLWKAITTRA
jgi:hypothetical protein